jgi:metal-responsive CopG/Arc/MetJ family transcriptional regulator
MEHNIMDRRLTVLLPMKLAADVERACERCEQTLSEFTRAALRAAVADAARLQPDRRRASMRS